MYYTPTKHQVEDSDAILDWNHAYLWADAGTGKTVTAMEALRKGGYKKLIVLCPKIALSMWKEELEKHMGVSPLTGEPYYARVLRTGAIPTKRKLNGATKGVKFVEADAIITTYDLFDKHKGRMLNFMCHTSLGKERHMDNRYPTVLILDEAHLIKNKDAKRSKAVWFFASLSKLPEEVWQLTGTPVLRYYDDLWNQLVIGRKEVLKAYGVETYDKFVNEFCKVEYKQYGKMGKPKRMVTGNRNSKKLENLLKDCKVIRRSLADVVDDLPPITHRSIYTEYKGVPESGVAYEDLIRELLNPDSELSTVRRALGVAKIPSVVEYVKDHGDRPILLGFWHKDVGREYKAVFSELYGEERVAIVDGSISTAQRDLIRERFNAGHIDVLCGQMQAMNASWNLQEACKHVIIAEELPSHGMLHQFYSRVYRRGQKQHVQVDHMRTAHELDQALAYIREVKQIGTERAGI